MPPLTLVCHTCGTPFQLAIQTTQATFIGSVATCPVCGEMNPIPDGAYDLSDVFKKIFQAEPTGEELTSLYAALQAPGAAASPQAAMAIVKTTVPRLVVPLNDVLGVAPSTWLRLLKALLTVLHVLVGAWKGTVAGAVAAGVVAYPKELVDKALREAEALESGLRRPKTKNQRKQERRKRRKRK